MLKNIFIYFLKDEIRSPYSKFRRSATAAIRSDADVMQLTNKFSRVNFVPVVISFSSMPFVDKSSAEHLSLRPVHLRPSRPHSVPLGSELFQPCRHGWRPIRNRLCYALFGSVVVKSEACGAAICRSVYQSAVPLTVPRTGPPSQSFEFNAPPPIGLEAQSTLGRQNILSENIFEKIKKCPNFFYMIFARIKQHFPDFFGWGTLHRRSDVRP